MLIFPRVLILYDQNKSDIIINQLKIAIFGCSCKIQIMIMITSREMVMGDSRDEPLHRIALPSRVFCTEFSPFEWSAK